MNIYEPLIDTLRDVCDRFPDRRTGKNIHFKEMHIFGLSAFSVFVEQNKSFLERSKDLSEGCGRANHATLFGLKEIPSDNQIRAMLDPVDPKLLNPVFFKMVDKAAENGLMKRFQCLDGKRLVALDGSEYHCSYSINCPHCSHRRTGASKDVSGSGEMQYFHSMVAPVLVGTDHDNVLPLPPAFIFPQDGHEKQDCEPVASMRWLREHAERMRPLNPVYLADDIYSRHSMCNTVLATGASFIFVAKETTHKLIWEYLTGAEDVPSLTVTKGRGARARKHTYRWLNAVPLRDGDDALEVNFFEVHVTDPQGKLIYHNSWVSDIEVTKHNVVEMVVAGRTRWKIENGGFNIMKTRGYNLEHNFGHGRQHLSSVLAAINVLAFGMHTLFAMLEPRWDKAMKKFSSRERFFSVFRSILLFVVFHSWDELVDILSFRRPAIHLPL